MISKDENIVTDPRREKVRWYYIFCFSFIYFYFFQLRCSEKTIPHNCVF